METLGDLLAAGRHAEDLAVRAAGRPTVEYPSHEFVTTAWKTANFFRARGVHEGSTVAVVDDPAVAPLLSFFGAACLGATTRFDPPAEVDARLLVGPGERVHAYDLPPGGRRVAYGDAVEDPAVEPFGRSIWSENPVEPPETVDPDAPALVTDTGEATHRGLLADARAASQRLDLGADDEVAVRAPLAGRETVVAGVLAPLLAGATVVFPGEREVGDVAIAIGDAPESRVLSVDG